MKVLKTMQGQQPMHIGLGPQQIQKKEFEIIKTKLDLMAEMHNFSLNTSCRLMTISLRRISGGAWWVLG